MSRSFYDALNKGRTSAYREELPQPYELDPPCKCGHDDIYHHLNQPGNHRTPCSKCPCANYREDR